MASDRKYDALLNQYNIAIAKARDLQEQLNKSRKQWESRDSSFAITEKLVRDLCAKILAKDPSEMRLGKEYTWRSIPVDELIRKASDFYDEYQESRLDLMKKLATIGEERLQKIETLKDQINIMQNDPTLSITMNAEELEEKVKHDKKEAEAKKKMDPDIRKNEDNLNVKAVETEAGDVEATDMINGMIDDMSAVTASSVPVKSENRETFERKVASKNNKKAEKGAKGNKKKENLYLQETEKELTGEDWALIEIIGKTGTSHFPTIEKEVAPEMFGDKYKSNALRSSMASLRKSKIIYVERVKTYMGSFDALKLSNLGKNIYCDRFGEDTYKISEMEILEAAHDNLKHGYGIRQLSDFFRKYNVFAEVSDTERSNSIKTKHGQYIPDIVAKDKKGKVTYIEYECVTQSAKDLKLKFTKMSSITPILNFICPNMDDANKLESIVEKWITERGMTSLSHVKLRISTGKLLTEGIRDAGNKFSDDESWKFVFICGKDKKPRVN